jgi:bifunctional DNA primase/polymerase-like protein
MNSLATTSSTVNPDVIDLIETALDMADQGYAVFPLVPGSKLPTNLGDPDSIAQHGRISIDWDDASTSDVDFLANHWPVGANVGIDTGKSGVIVVDVDVKHGPGKQEWDLLCKHYGDGDLPRTFTVRTASGGWHFYFEANGVEMRNSKGLLAKNIDIRAQGGYVVGWGSVVPNGVYEVIHDDEVAPTPGWLVQLEADLRRKREASATAHRGHVMWELKMLTPGQVERRIDGLASKLAEHPEGDRNQLLNWTAMKLGELAAGGRITEDHALEICKDACERNGLATDDGDYAVRATFRSGFNAGFGGAR